MLRVSVEFLCPAEPKNFAGEPFCGVLQKVYGSEKLYEQEGGEYQDFASKIFCLTVRKSFVDKPFWVSLIWVSKNFMLKGVRHDFSSNSFCLAEPKNFAGEPFCAVFQKDSGSEIFEG